MAYKVFSNGNALNASELNTYLMNQSVMVFSNASARDAALAVPLAGQIAYLEDTDRYYWYDSTQWIKLVASLMVDKASSYSLIAADEGKTIRSTGSAITITVDDVLTQPGDRIDFIQAGTGQITFASGSGVTLNSKGGKTKTSGQYSGATIMYSGSGVYYLIGDLG